MTVFELYLTLGWNIYFCQFWNSPDKGKYGYSTLFADSETMVFFTMTIAVAKLPSESPESQADIKSPMISIPNTVIKAILLFISSTFAAYPIVIAIKSMGI